MVNVYCRRTQCTKKNEFLLTRVSRDSTISVLLHCYLYWPQFYTMENKLMSTGSLIESVNRLDYAIRRTSNEQCRMNFNSEMKLC